MSKTSRQSSSGKETAPWLIHLPPVVLVILLIFSFINYFFVSESFRRRSLAEFESETNDVQREIEERIQIAIDSLFAIQGFFAASQSVERDEWKIFLSGQRIFERHPSFGMIGIVERVLDVNKTKFVQSVIQDISVKPEGYPDFHIHPEGQKADYYVLKYVEPGQENDSFLGFDLSSDRTYAFALKEIRDTNQIYLTSKVRLGFYPHQGASGFAFFLPIMANEDTADAASVGAKSLWGAIMATVDPQKIFSELFGRQGVPSDLRIEVFLGNQPNRRSLLFEYAYSNDDMAEDKLFQRVSRIHLANREWTLRFRSSQGIGLSPIERKFPVILLSITVAVSFLIFLILLSLSRARTKAWVLAESMTQELRYKQQEVQMVIDSALDGVLTLDLHGTIINWNRKAEEIWGWTRREVEGKKLVDLFVNADDRMRIEEGLEYFEDKGEWIFSNKFLELPVRHKNGPTLIVELSMSVLHMGDTIRYSVFVRDLTLRRKSEEAVRESESRFRTLVANLPGAVYRCLPDEKRTVHYISDAIQEISGYSSSEFIANLKRSFNKLIAIDDLPHATSLIQQGLRLRRPYMLEYRIANRDGQTRWVYDKGQGVFDDQGNLQWLDGAIFDVSERKEVQEKIKASEEKFRSLVENVKVGLVRTTIDTPGRVVEANLFVAQMFGYESVDEILQTDVAVHYWDPRDRKELVVELLTRSFLHNQEIRFKNKHGHLIWGLVNAQIFYGEGRKPLWIDSVLQDITQRKRYEQELFEKEERLRLAMSTAQLGIWEWDIGSDNVVWSNDMGPRFGFAYGAITGTFADFYKNISLEDKEEFQRVLNQTVDRESTLNCEFRIHGTENMLRWASLKAKVYRDTSGQALRLVGIIQDITEKRNTQEELISLEKAKTVEQLAAGAAHEVKNPLAILLQGLEFLKNTNEHPDQTTTQVLTDMDSAVHRADTIIKDLLTLARPSEAVFKPADINALLEHCVLLLRTQLSRSRIKAQFQLCPDIPLIDIDREKIVQVFINILSNAMEAVGEGGEIFIRSFLDVPLDISHTSLESLETKNKVWITIEDNGPGIPAYLLEKIFEPFFTTKRAKGGTGLGLSIVKQIMQMHQGTIKLINRKQGGACVIISFPKP